MLPVTSLALSTRVAALLVIGTAVVLITLPGLGGPLVLDSVKLYALESLVAEHGNRSFLHTPGFPQGWNRIAAMFTFVLNVQIEGQVSAFQIKLTNVLIHLLCGISVYFFARLLATAATGGEKGLLIALFAAAFWLLSPANLNVVLYAIQRMAQLSALFSLWALIAYTLGRLHAEGPWSRLVCFALSVVFMVLAFLSKQNAVLVVVLVLLTEVYLLNVCKPVFRRRHFWIAGAAMVAGALFVFYFLYPSALNYGSRDFTLGERLLTQPRVLVWYLQDILVPVSGDTHIYGDDFQASRHLLQPISTLFCLLAVLVLIGLSVVFRRPPFTLAAFGALFFFSGHLLESTVLPLELFFVHRNYLPTFGVYLVLASVLAALPKGWMMAAVAMLLGLYSTMGMLRAITWSSHDRISASAIRHHPGSPRALALHTQLALERGEVPVALAAADRLYRQTGTLNAQLQKIYVSCAGGLEITADELDRLQQARRPGLRIEVSQALGNLLNLYQAGGCKQLPVAALVASLDEFTQQRIAGSAWYIHYYSDTFLYAAGFRERAVSRLESRLEAGQLKPGLYLVSLHLEGNNPRQAAQVLGYIRKKFDPKTLDRYQSDIRRFEETMRALQGNQVPDA